MKRLLRSVLDIFLILALVTYLSSCTTVMSGIDNTKLQTQAKMSNTIFLNPVSPSEKTIFIDIHNTSQVQMPDLKAMIAQKLQANGYRIVEDPKRAHYWLQANVLYMGKESKSATFDGALLGGFGGALAGASVGQHYGKAGAALGGAAVGSLLGALAGSAIHVDTYLGIVDIQVQEEVHGTITQTVASNYSQGESGAFTGASVSSQYQKQTNYQAYRTRIAVEAKQTNMDLQKVTPNLENLIASEIAGIF